MIQFWTGFYSKVTESHTRQTLVTYAPVVDSKPSDMNTVFTTMKKCMGMSKVVGQHNSIQTFDQQLYAVSQQVKWSMPNVFRTHILQLGGFHTLSCFIASIDKLWADGGLRDLMVDSGVYTGCTVDQMLSGKQFNRAVRGLTLVDEALMYLWFVAFFKWCVENGHCEKIPQDVWVTLSKSQSAFTDNSNTAAVALSELKGIYTNHLLPLIRQFRDWGQRQSPTFKYWNMFLSEQKSCCRLFALNVKACGLWIYRVFVICCLSSSSQIG